MSTHALIAYKNEDETYDINCINFDGYIEGVGKTLQNYWNDNEKAMILCHAKEIRTLEKNKMECYTCYFSLLNKRTHISFDKLRNESGNFDYTYIYENNMWQILTDIGFLETY